MKPRQPLLPRVVLGRRAAARSTQPWFLLLAILGLQTGQATADFVRVFVELAGDPEVEVVLQADPGIEKAVLDRRLDRKRVALKDQHARLMPQLEALGAIVEHSFTLLNNGLTLEIPSDQLPHLAKLADVLGVFPEQHYEPMTQTSVPFVGAPNAWQQNLQGIAGVTGRGIRIGIIDSGIDYLHATFGGAGTEEAYAANDPTRIESGTFPTAKVIGGWDFVGDNYDSTGEYGSRIPQPDPDPLDPQANGHGTHVAGIAAGFGVVDGQVYTGPYDARVNEVDFDVGPGVAPEALLYAIKVFGRQGRTSSNMILQALNLAADPNRDGSTSDRLDVVNLSLGTAFGRDDAINPEIAAVNRLVALGCVVVVSAGNGGNTAYKVVRPGTSPQALTVANSFDDGFGLTAIRVDAPSAIAGPVAAVEGEFTPPLSEVGPVTAQVAIAQPVLACGPLQNSAALNGKIAWIERGTCFFTEKIERLQAAGAIGVIVVNNVPGPPIVMGAAGDPPPYTLPAVMISQDEGVRLRPFIAQGLQVTLSATELIGLPELADTLSEGSSRGPLWPTSRLKPDLAAPGVSILSAAAGQGSGQRVDTGTSMSAPHVAGAAALLRQLHPSWAVVDIKAALMNTAWHPMTDESGNRYPESRVGAGRLSVKDAVNTEVTAHAVSAVGEVSVSFGAFEAAETVVLRRTLQVRNHGSESRTLSVSTSQTTVHPGVTIRPLIESITLGPESSEWLDVELIVDPSGLIMNPDRTSPTLIDNVPRIQMQEIGGQVWLHEGSWEIHVPWFGSVRPIGSHEAGWQRAGLPPMEEGMMPIPTRGSGGPGQPLIGVFEMGRLEARQGLSAMRAATDIVAIGVATDRGRAGSIAASQLHFVVVTDGRWLTPQRIFHEFEIQVDRTFNALPNAVLTYADAVTLREGLLETTEAASDAWVTALNTPPLNTWTVVGPWHPLDPQIHDIVGFQGAAMVFSVPAASLGLTDANSAFQYRVLSRGEFNDSTAWTPFNPARWRVDPTVESIDESPFWPEGRSAQVRFHRGHAQQAVSSSQDPVIPLLLVHWHNAPGRQHEQVLLDLSTGDADGDGLPDVWELRWLGDMDSDGTGDRDGDGASDWEEFIAGTDPLDPNSRLELLVPNVLTEPLRWTSVAGRRYAVLRSDRVEGPYQVLASGIEATPDINTYMDPELLPSSSASSAEAGPWFYRIQVEWP